MGRHGVEVVWKIGKSLTPDLDALMATSDHPDRADILALRFLNSWRTERLREVSEQEAYKELNDKLLKQKVNVAHLYAKEINYDAIDQNITTNKDDDSKLLILLTFKKINAQTFKKF